MIAELIEFFCDGGSFAGGGDARVGSARNDQNRGARLLRRQEPQGDGGPVVLAPDGFVLPEVNLLRADLFRRGRGGAEREEGSEQKRQDGSHSIHHKRFLLVHQAVLKFRTVMDYFLCVAD